MFQADDGQDEYMVQQKVSYRIYEQEQKVRLRSRYPFLSPVQISRKVRDSWNRLKQEAKQFYTKSVLIKTPTKDLTKTTPKPKHKRSKVKGRLDVKREEECEVDYEDSMESPNQVSLFTSPVNRRQQNNKSAYRSDFYSPPVVSPDCHADIRNDKSCHTLIESPIVDSSPHQKFDMFKQKNYTKSKLPLEAPKIIQDEHSTQGILKGSRTDDTPKTKVKGRVSFSTDKDESIQQSQDYMDNSHYDDSEDEYNAMLIRREDDSYNFDDIDEHDMIVEDDRQGEVSRNQNKNGEVLKFDNRQKMVVSKKTNKRPEKEQLQKKGLKETVERKNILKPANSENVKEKKRRGREGNCTEKASKRSPVSYGNERQKKEKQSSGGKERKHDFSDVQLQNRLHIENSPSEDSGHKSSQSNDSANDNSQSNDSFCDNSQSNYSVSDNSQSCRSSVQDMKSPNVESKKTRSIRTKQNKKETKRGTRFGQKPGTSVSMTMTRDYDLTPVHREATKFLTPQMDESVHTHNLREASKIPRKARRSSCQEEDYIKKPPDNNLEQSPKLKKLKRRSSRKLEEEKEAYTEVKQLQVISDRFTKDRKKENSILVDASGDAKSPESPIDKRRSLRSKTEPVIQSNNVSKSPHGHKRSLRSKTKQGIYPEKPYNPVKYCDNDEDITKLSDHSDPDSWTIMDEEYNSEVLAEDENSNPAGQSDASKALVQALHKMKQVMDDEDTSDERSSPKLLSPALSGISQMSSVSSDSSATNSQSTYGKGPNKHRPVSTDKQTVTQGLCEMFGDMTPPQKRTSGHNRRLLASSTRETGSNFSQLFKSQNIFC